MHLEAADVDDSSAAADEMVAPIAQLHTIAEIDESFCIAQRRSTRTEVGRRIAGRFDSQRPATDVQLDAMLGCIDQARGKSCAPITHLETNTGLGGGEGMRHHCTRKRSAQRIENALIGDLTGKAYI